MNRREFTKNKTILLQRMIDDGNSPIEDYLLRSKEEQNRLFLAKLSKCDGIIKISGHQKALAEDIYFVVTRPDGSVFIDFDFKETFDLAVKYHDIWVGMGGKPIILWDLCHYESA